MKKQFVAVMLAALALAVGCSKEQIEGEHSFKKTTVTAIVEELDEHILTMGYEEEDETRYGVSEETLAGGSWAFFWEPGDAMGVYTNAGENNVRYVNTKSEKASSATFAPDTVEVTGTPLYAYYPFNENGGEDYTAINGYLPSENSINKALTTVPGIHRRGMHKTNSGGVTTFSFKNLFATVRFQMDAAGTKLEGCRVKSIKITAKRLFLFSLPICGSFTFNAEDLTYTTKSTSNTMVFNFEGYPTLESALTFATAMFPNIKKSDRFYFTVEAVGYTATFNVASAVAMVANNGYTYALPLKNYSNLKIKTNNIQYVEPEEPTEPEEPETPTDPVEPEKPTVTTGTFTAATYNVDGLPQKVTAAFIPITINGDGPGSDGTKSISQKIAAQNWDFVGFSEDFAYNTELMSSLSSAFKFGTHRGSVSASQLTKRADTDGLQFATRNATCTWLSEDYSYQFSNEHGGLTSGANTCIKKGIRHYEVQVAEGVVVDVLITHMNTYSDDSDKFIDAQHGQLTEVAEYINKTMAANNRPIIFMGDTNCRYTRHNFATYFWGKLNSDLTYADPWVTYQWNGVYPTYPSKSLMVSDATGTDEKYDIICENTQKGEVVDKVIYINKASNAVQIEATSYLRDYDNFQGLADHKPIVVGFKWTKKETK